MTAPTMPAETAAWIRDHVWTAAMRRDTTGRDACACQYGPTGHCQAGHCEKCPRGVPLPSWETVICGRDGVSPCAFPEPFEHKTGTSATGPRYEFLAMVWLADRACRWVCSCPHGCHARETAPPPPPPPAPKPKPKPAPHATVPDRPLELGQLDMFAALP
jgi:hypothetical protein